MLGAPEQALLALVISSIAILFSLLAYVEARRVSLLLESAISVGRLRELARLRRALAARPSRRYIVFSIIAEEGEDIGSKVLSRELSRAARLLLGYSFAANSGFSLVYYNPFTRKGIIRVRSNYKHAALAVLSIVRRIGNSRVLLIPERTTGTIRKARKYADR